MFKAASTTLICSILLSGTAACEASANQNGAYRPLDGWGFVGYKDRKEKDGTWRIVANSARMHGTGFALNMATYRAAELARDAGYPYVEILGDDTLVERGLNANLGNERVVLFARPSKRSNRPVTCRSRMAAGCYTANVDVIMARLVSLLNKPAQ